MENLSTFVRTLGNQFIKGRKVFVDAIKIEGTLIDGTSTVGTSGQVLSTTGTGVEWITVGSSDVGELNDLTDVIISTASTGQLLRFDGESWVNWTHDFLGGVSILSPTSNEFIKYNGTNWVNASVLLSELGDTSISSPSADQILVYGQPVGGEAGVNVWYNKTPNYLTSYTETDPVYTGSSWYTTANNATNWDAAYGWGDHDGLYSLVDHTHSVFTQATSEMVDGEEVIVPGSNGFVPASGVNDDNKFLRSDGTWQVATTDLTGYATENWVGEQGYLTSYTETDPVFTGSDAFNISQEHINNWDEAYGWGDHSEAGYITSFSESDTLDDVTGRGNTTTNLIDVGGVTTDYVQFDTSVTLAGDEDQGYMAWNDDVDTVSVYPYDSQWFNIGQDMHWHVKNGTAEVIARGTVVMATGTVGNSSKIEAGLMVSDGTVNSKYIIGVALRDISAGEFGKVVTQGTIRGIDTQLFQEGDVLWCDPQNDGGLTNVEPSAPNLRLPIAFVVSSAENGSIAVRITQGNVLHELHDVNAASPSDGDLLGYNSTDGIWENFTPDYAASIHNHDDRYYTETEVDTLLSGKSDTDHAHDRATTESDGFMSAGDKEKLDGIEENANNYSLPIAGTSLGGVKSGTDISVDENGNVAVLDDSHTHDGRYYTETESDGRYARGVTINYSSVDNDPEEDAWYKLFQITDSGSSPVICFLRGYAHSSVTFIVSEGYLGSNAHVQILDYLTSTNNNYKWIKGVRIISNGDVEVLLNGGPNVSLEMSIIGDAVYLNQPRLSTALAADVRDSVTGLTNGMIRAKGDVTGANLNISNWNTAYGWGDHAAAGYLTSYTETDPIYTASSWYTTSNNATNWDTAYGWGNHAGLYAEIDHTHEISDVAGLQDELDRKIESESDTLDSVTDRGATTTNDVTVGGLTANGDTITFLNESAGDKNINIRKRYDAYSFINWIRSSNTDAYMGVDASENFQIGYASSGLERSLIFTSNNSEVIRFDSSGNVGIGTTSPSYKLEVYGADAKVKINNTTSTNTNLTILDLTGTVQGSGTGNERAILFGKDGNIARQAKISYLQESSNGQLPSLAFFTGDNDDSLDERMRISSAGNLGIGTTSPSYRLDVAGDARFYDSSVAGSGILIDTGAANLVKLRAGYPGDWAATSIQIQSSTTSGLDNGIYLESGGNVGIGTTDPSYKLDVAGDIYVSNGESLYLGNANSRISSNSSADILYFPNRDNVFGSIISGADVERMRITEAGNVGIGTTSPEARLHISANSVTQLYLERTGSITGKFRIGVAGANNRFYITDIAQSEDRLIFDENGELQLPAYTAGLLKTDASGNVSLDTSTYLTSYTETDTLDSVTDRGATTTNTITVGGALISATAPLLDFVDTNSFTDVNDRFRVRAVGDAGRIQWYDSSASSTLDLMHFSLNGNVGIGTTNPAGVLHVSGVANYNTGIIASGNTVNGVGLGLLNEGGKDWYLISTGSSNGGGANNLGIYEAQGNYRLYLKSGGNVGIGTTNPSARLNISGTSTGAAIDWSNTTATTGRSFRWVSLNSGGFAVEDLTASGANRLTITGSGRLGVGTSSPAYHIHGVSAETGWGYSFQNATADEDVNVYMSHGGGYGIAVDSTENASNKYLLKLSGGTGAGTGIGTVTRMIVTTAGNVGIGTTSPSYTLDVNGSFNATSVNVTDDITASAGNLIVQNGAGIYSIKSTIQTSASAVAFRVANTNGVQAARATFVSETDVYKVAKIYEVVKAGDADPVAFKVVDTGPSAEEDFSVSFSNDGGDLLCTVTNDSANESLTLVTTIFVGGSNTSQTVSNS